MAAKSLEWRPGPSVCRCCFAEGCYKDISTEYFWMGKREVYSEMLNETFDVTIAYSQSGGPNSNSRLICEPCISRLRDASDFKRQVQECEKTFMQHLDPGSSSLMELEVSIEPLDKEVKLERVKQERKLSDDDFDDHVDFGDDDDDDDDLDDQPLTKLASKVPKKESVDILEILDTKAEKRKSTTKVKVAPAKKPKKKETIIVKASASKPAQAKPEKKKKADNRDPARCNAEAIIRNTTAYPFRVNDKCILCVYCQELFEDPDAFRSHMDAEHQSFSVKVAFHNLPKPEYIKADCTNLKCRLCDQPFEGLDNIAVHLKQTHNEGLDLTGKLGVMPYLLQKDGFNCAVCSKNYPSLFHLNRHTITHFLSYVCHVCGSSYVASTGLLRHVRSKHQQYEVSCKRCQKVFPSMDAKERHRRTEKSCMPYCCPKCPERFLDWKTRKRHMETEHGHERKTLRCSDCDIVFNVENTYYEHYRLQHSGDCSVCKHCGLKFLSLNRLKRHLKRHSL